MITGGKIPAISPPGKVVSAAVSTNPTLSNCCTISCFLLSVNPYLCIIQVVGLSIASSVAFLSFTSLISSVCFTKKFFADCTNGDFSASLIASLLPAPNTCWLVLLLMTSYPFGLPCPSSARKGVINNNKLKHKLTNNRR